jgi:hypothetical protein
VRWFLAALLVASAVVTPAGGMLARSNGARVVVVDRSPVTVRGVQFKTRESVTVRVVIRGGPRASKAIQAGGGGTWTARFPTLRAGHCASVIVRATGARGSTAAYTEQPPPCGAAP